MSKIKVDWNDMDTIPKETDVLVYRSMGMPPIVAALFDGGLLSFDNPDKVIVGAKFWSFLPESPNA